MASGTLYTYPENFRAYKILIAAQYSKTKVKVAPNFVFGETNKSEAFLKKFPLGKVPAFESDDEKLFLTESNAIAFYVANQQLRGNTPLDKTQVLQWLGFADSEILPVSCVLVFPILGILPWNKQATDRAKEDVKIALNYLNTHLLDKTYLVGKRITLADICVACTLLHLYQYFLDPEFRKPYANVNRWFTTIVNQPQAKAVLGDVKLCDKPAEFDAKKQKGGQEKGKGGKQEKQQKQQQHDAAQGDKAKGKGKEKEKEQEAAFDEEMDEEAAKPKTKNPFASLPAGNFKMDDFKVCYSNEDESKSIPYFWQKFDPEHYSIWFTEYKYNDELQKIFMTCNLVSGMFQRLDSMRKGAFASMCIFGTDNDNSISGIWVWRGQDLAFDLCPDWQVDYTSYSWTKLDPSSPKTKELVEQYLSWTGTDSAGRKFNQGKIFK